MVDEFVMPMSDGEFSSTVNAQRQQLGAFSEMIAAAALFRYGAVVSKPLLEAKGYDLIADVRGSLIRVQVKTISSSNQAPLGFSRARPDGSRRVMLKYTDASFDWLACVDRDTLEVFMVPARDIDFMSAAVSMSHENRHKYQMSQFAI
jgi:hypothetical protein